MDLPLNLRTDYVESAEADAFGFDHIIVRELNKAIRGKDVADYTIFDTFRDKVKEFIKKLKRSKSGGKGK